VLSLWDLIFYGVVAVTPSAPATVFGFAEVQSRGHVVLTILAAMIAMVLTAIVMDEWPRYPSAGSAYTYVSRVIHPYCGFDLTKPNEAYFVRLDHIVQLATNHHLAVFLDPMETIGWLPTLRNNGMKAAYAYGQFLGYRYRGFKNVLWLNGNDFNMWTMQSDDALVQAVSKGIRSVASNQLQTVELHVRTSSSFDDPRWIPLIELNSTYTYHRLTSRCCTVITRRRLRRRIWWRRITIWRMLVNRLISERLSFFVKRTIRRCSPAVLGNSMGTLTRGRSRRGGRTTSILLAYNRSVTGKASLPRFPGKSWFRIRITPLLQPVWELLAMSIPG
jgi:hypothetical protein